jgi:drug/metabolite transporter (DMT)-like permease
MPTTDAAAQLAQRPPRSLTAGLLGSGAIFLSAFCYYLSTVVIRWSQDETVIDPTYFAVFRFLMGFAVVCGVMLAKGQGPRPKRFDLLIGRMATNCVAVCCFYQAVRSASVAEANILNMTYPIFIAVFSWTLLRQQRDKTAMAMVAAASFGIWLILSPGRLQFRIENLWGLASAVATALSLLYLNVSRQHHDTNTILFYMFGLGAIVTYALFHDRIFWPDATALRYLAGCGACGIAGQFLITVGFRYVTAVEGGIISSTRILLAGLLGPWLATEPALGAAGWLGALLIFAANVVLAWRKARPTA